MPKLSSKFLCDATLPTNQGRSCIKEWLLLNCEGSLKQHCSQLQVKMTVWISVLLLPVILAISGTMIGDYLRSKNGNKLAWFTGYALLFQLPIQNKPLLSERMTTCALSVKKGCKYLLEHGKVNWIWWSPHKFKKISKTKVISTDYNEVMTS